MRRWIIIFIAGLLGTPLLLRVIELDESFVVLVLGATTVEMPLWFVIVTALLLSAAGYFFARMLRTVLLTPKRMNRWLNARRQRKTQDLTLNGFLSLLEGNWTAASRDLQKAAEKSDTPVLNYLLAAQARIENSDLASAETLIRKAEQLVPDASVAIGILHAQLLQQAGVPEKAHTILLALAGENPRHAHLKKLLLDSYRLRGDTQTVLQTLSLQHRQKPLQDPHQITELCRLQIAHGASAQAEEILRKQLGKQWRAEWVSLFGQAAASDGVKQLQIAEKWLKDHPQDSHLLLALARIAQRNHLWAKARDYYESYLTLQAHDNEANAALVRLLHALGEHEKARHWMQKHPASPHTLPLPMHCRTPTSWAAGTSRQIPALFRLAACSPYSPNALTRGSSRIQTTDSSPRWHRHRCGLHR
jgi:HemY protein